MNIQQISHTNFQRTLKRTLQFQQNVNFKKILKALANDHVYLAEFDNEETVVAMGRIVSDISYNFKDLSYAVVPLGIITRGKVIVFENGKAVRHLGVGDFVGLFETAHYLHFNAKKRLGNWTLLAEGETEIAFFGHMHFDHRRKESKKSLEHYLIELSKKDRTPKPLTELPVLDRFADLRNIPLQEDVLVIIHTHLLESSYSLFRHIAAAVGYQNVFVLDKPYSTVPAVADKVVEMGVDLTRVAMKNGLAYEFAVQDSIRILWNKVLSHTKKVAISKIVIIDDGAEILTNVPWRELKEIDVVGVEQTTRGIVRLGESFGQYPSVINVAGSALKKEIESIFIANAISQEIIALSKKIKKSRIGIVGTGNIGKNIIFKLEKEGLSINSYDFSKFNSFGISKKGSVTSVSEIIEKNDIIIGATGKDFLRGVVLDKAKGEKILVSASSADVEFYSILNRAGFPENSFGTVSFEPQKGLTFKILNAGYPINFNRQKEIESAQDMQLTRTLLFAGFVQSLQVTKRQMNSIVFKLDIDFQREILNIFIAANQKVKQYVLSTLQIEKRSEGEILKIKNGDVYRLHETTSPYLDIVRKHTEPYITKVFGKEIIIYPEVMSPKYDWAGIFGVETLPDVKDKTVLELGCGSGIISLFAALRGAKQVDAIDINLHAIKNTQANFDKYSVTNAKAFYSDLFSNIKTKYDVVIFNLPYHGNKPNDILEHGVADEDYKMMKKFIAELPKYIKDNGIAHVGFSTSGDTKLLLEQFKKSKLEIIEKYSDERFGYNCDAYILKKKK